MSTGVAESAGTVRLGRTDGRWVLAAMVLGSSMAFLDATAVNIALPTIGRQLHASLAGLQWTVTAYTLTLAGLILLGGSLGDRLGRRRVFTIGVTWFALASALCGLAPHIAVLIGARVLQGIGGALLTPGSLAIIQASFAPQDRPKAVGAWSGLSGVAGAAGPLLGGWIVADAGWRWVFLLNLPLAAVVLAVTRKHVPESRDTGASGGFDVAGAGLAALALAGITYALIEAPAGNGPAGPAAAAVIAIAAAIAFFRTERRRGRSPGRVPPMLPLGVFGARQFTVVNIVTLLVYGALGGMLFLLVLQLQLVVGFSALAAGTALLPTTVLMLVLSPRAGALAQRVGPRWLMTGGTTTCAAGLLLMTRIVVLLMSPWLSAYSPETVPCRVENKNGNGSGLCGSGSLTDFRRLLTLRPLAKPQAPPADAGDGGSGSSQSTPKSGAVASEPTTTNASGGWVPAAAGAFLLLLAAVAVVLTAREGRSD